MKLKILIFDLKIINLESKSQARFYNNVNKTLRSLFKMSFRHYSSHVSNMNETIGLGSISNNSNNTIYDYLEQTQLNEKRVEQMAREKREMLSKTLEENKEKMELSQKLLLMDKENSQLKSDLRKITLEK